MVVIIQPGFRQPLGLSAVKRAQRHASFHAHRFHALHHLLQIRHIALVRVLPRRAHAKRVEPFALALRADSSTCSTCINRSDSRPVL